MKALLGVLLLFLFFISCEDKQKTPTEKVEVTKETIKDSIIKETVVKEEKPQTAQYPEITNENVVSFLTEYGKANPETKVKITTRFGDIFIELYKDTPLHRANFIYLVKQKYFDNTFFHRVVPDFIIQAGNSDTKATPLKRKKLGFSYLLPAELENGRRHTRGTVSGAKEYRENPDKQTAPYEFFIFLGPDKYTSHLNGNYTIFGRVTQGMDVVDTISKLPRDDGEWPLQNVFITAEIVE